MPMLSRERGQIPSYERSIMVNGFCHGLESQNYASVEWFSNQRMMRALCQEFDIEYSAFLQPAGIHLAEYQASCDVRYRTQWFLYSVLHWWGEYVHELGGAQYRQEDPGGGLSDFLSNFVTTVFRDEVRRERFSNVKINGIETFYFHARKFVETCDFICDASSIFNGMPEVIFDNCHCVGSGNRIIAQRIFDEINANGILSRARGKVASRHASL
jgi:hypothetical protein